MTKGCLYCGIQLPDTTNFCPKCGRPTEQGFGIRPIQESEFDRLRRETRERDERIQKQGFYYECSGPFAHTIQYAWLGYCTKKVWLHTCPNCLMPTITDNGRNSHCHRCQTAYQERNIQQVDCGAPLVKRDLNTRK